MSFAAANVARRVRSFSRDGQTQNWGDDRVLDAIAAAVETAASVIRARVPEALKTVAMVSFTYPANAEFVDIEAESSLAALVQSPNIIVREDGCEYHLSGPMPGTTNASLEGAWTLRGGRYLGRRPIPSSPVTIGLFYEPTTPLTLSLSTTISLPREALDFVVEQTLWNLIRVDERVTTGTKELQRQNNEECAARLVKNLETRHRKGGRAAAAQGSGDLIMRG